jgi:hypothetical protein
MGEFVIWAAGVSFFVITACSIINVVLLLDIKYLLEKE